MSVSADPLAPVAALPGVARAAAAARAAVDRVAGNGALRLRQADITAETALRGARASAALAGVDVELAALRSGAAFEDPLTAPVTRGAVRVSTELGLLRTTWVTAPRQALARLHAVAAADALTDPDALGRPASAAAAARLDQLTAALTARTAAPGIVVAAVVHGEVLAAEAFGWGSGLVARAAARCVLIARGVDARGVIAPEVGHVQLGVTGYQKALDGYAGGTVDGVAAWVVHCSRALELAAADALRVCASMR